MLIHSKALFNHSSFEYTPLFVDKVKRARKNYREIKKKTCIEPIRVYKSN